MSYTVLNDVHIGAKRQGGTTPQSQAALQDYLQESFGELLNTHQYRDLIIAGDLFDNFEVDTRTVLGCYNILANWLENTGRAIFLIAGNHDWSPRGDKLSSFHFLAALLTSRFKDNVGVIDQGLTEIRDSVWAIPHMPNQDLFQLELDKALDTGPMTVLILHANYNNKFALKADHSLNVSREIAQKFADREVTLVFGHEHQAKTDISGRVVILGNQLPSSIADCLGNNEKFAHVLTPCNREIDRLRTWGRLGKYGYAEIDWSTLDPSIECGEMFIRVTGTALAEEAEAVVEAIAAYRAKSNAFVVGNAVKVDGLATLDSLEAASAETIKSFDVLGALLEGMTERESQVLRSLL